MKNMNKEVVIQAVASTLLLLFCWKTYGGWGIVLWTGLVLRWEPYQK